MKNFLSLSLIASLLLISAHSFGQKKHILDYYKLLPIGKDYIIKKINDKYVTYGVTESPIAVTVDFKNGYIAFEDEGTGGGTFSVQAVLYRKTDGSALIAYSSKSFDGVGLDASPIDFFEDKAGKLVSANTKYRKSELEFERTILNKFPEDRDRTIASELIQPYFKLPQNGLTIEVNFFVVNYVNEDETKKIEIQQKLKKMDLKTIHWKYIKSKDQFEFVDP